MKCAFNKIKKIDAASSKSRQKNKTWLHFQLAPFVFPEWKTSLRKTSAANEERLAKIRQKRVEDETRLRELRQQLSEKEKKLKKLKESKELAPTKKFVESVESAKAKKRSMMGEHDQLEKKLKTAKKELRHFEKEVAEVKLRRKRVHGTVYYTQKKLSEVSVMGSKAAVLKRKNNFASEQLKHEENELKELKEDFRILQNVQDEMEIAIEESKDSAFFDAKADVSYQAIKFGDDKKETYGKHRKDVMQVIGELIEIGIDAESIETLFESVFQCLKFPVKRFPPTNILHRLFVKQKRKGSVQSDTAQ